MTDNFITGGSVSIEDGTKAAEEYAPARKVAVKISFEVPEGEEGQKFLNAAADVAQDKVNELLGKQPAKEAVVDASPAGSDKAALEAAAGLKPTEEPEDDLNDLLGESAPVPITDAELAKAAQNKNAQMKAKDPNFSVKIRALVVEYAGQPPKKITDVPVAKRQEFLEKLRELS